MNTEVGAKISFDADFLKGIFFFTLSFSPD
jgi:hypothetical protein